MEKPLLLCWRGGQAGWLLGWGGCLLPGWKLQSIFLAVTQPKATASALSVGVKWVQTPCCGELLVGMRLTQPSQSGACAAALEISTVMKGS